MTPTHRYRLSLWKRIAAKTPCEFRSACLKEGLSSHTIERTILVAIHYGLTQPDGSNPLRHDKPRPNPPSLSEISLAYSKASQPAWPIRMKSADRIAWWQGFLCFTLYTGLRLGDLASVRWSDIDGTLLSKSARKTGKTHRIPLIAPVLTHLEKIPRRGETVFGLTACYRQLRRELRKLGPSMSPQQLRQASMLLWWRAGGDRAVEIVHGTGIRGVLGHYLQSEEILREASMRISLPIEMLPESERQKEEEEATELLRRFKMAPSATRRLMLDLSRKLA